MNSGSQVRLKLGKAETKLGVIGEEQTVRIAYRAVATGDVPVPPAEFRVTIGACRIGDYFDGVACRSCGAGHYIPSDVKNVTAGQPGYDASCFPCLAGHYSLVANATECEACPAGTASGVVAANAVSTCVACAEDTISGAGAGACVACGFGQMSNHGNTACVLSSSMLISIVTVLVAMFVGTAAMASLVAVAMASASSATMSAPPALPASTVALIAASTERLRLATTGATATARASRFRPVSCLLYTSPSPRD